jgi:anaphase-promoting complex subunit 2
VRYHLVQHVLPLLSVFDASAQEDQVLLGSIRTLDAAHRQYLYGLSLVMRGMDQDAADTAKHSFRRDLHAIIGNSASATLIAALRSVVARLMRTVLGITGRQPGGPLDLFEAENESPEVTKARQDLRILVEALHKVGLAGERFQVLVAEAMDAMMVEYIQTSYAGVWKFSYPTLDPTVKKTKTESACIVHLSSWVENHYSRLVVEILGSVGIARIAWTDVEKWKEIAIGRLAVLRIHELFDIVLNWPETKSVLDDLRSAVKTPQRRLQLTDNFVASLQKQLLHPGRSTVDILQVYISMIRAFHYLDHSKVLLERVAHSLRYYLCQRDDAVRIVVTGLLCNPADTSPAAREGKLFELAQLLNDPSQQRRQASEDEDLDWNDMEWIPAPVDAGVNYKRPKSEDVIGTLLNALGSPEVFIKEFQNTLAERLLSNQRDFTQETKVLNLLKKRFGENALQNCDVMMKDIQDSKRVDTIIVRNIVWPPPTEPDEDPKAIRMYHSKILSRLFWPSLTKDPFVVPKPVAEIQDQYERGYEQLKSSRKLTWLDHLGRAAVHLDLEDRIVDTHCKTYEAAVIYAFAEDPSYTGPLPVRRTVTELQEMLQIDEDLLELSLNFWVHHRVIRQIEEGTFVVIEKLEDETAMDQAGPQSLLKNMDDGGDLSPRKPAGGRAGPDAKEKERRQVYWQFIVGMLTNSAPTMPLNQMAMMMKMLIADGFHWSNEELQEFLSEKIAEKELELVGGKYRLPKK